MACCKSKYRYTGLTISLTWMRGNYRPGRRRLDHLQIDLRVDPGVMMGISDIIIGRNGHRVPDNDLVVPDIQTKQVIRVM